MPGFDDRRDAFEKKFARDEELQFKVDARANRILGMWAAGYLGLSGEAAGNYASEVIGADFEEAGREDVFRKLAGDLGDAVEEMAIRRQMELALEQARQEIFEES
ncbi:MAG: DUF1476 domain-containing protein [Rhodobacteraceae bacterium]|nr:DUF1476 domain-containing protein [Paracoccaceae bacterium]